MILQKTFLKKQPGLPSLYKSVWSSVVRDFLHQGKYFLTCLLFIFSAVAASAQIQWKVLGSEDQLSSGPAEYTTITTAAEIDTVLSASFGQTHWQVLADEDQLSTAAADYTTLTTLTENNIVIPYVAFTVAGAARVHCLKNGTWQNVGGDVATADASYTNIFRDHAGKLYVAYVDGGNGNRLAVKTYDTTSKKWEPMGGDAANLYVSTGSILNGTKQLVISHNSWMAFDTHNVPYIVYAEMDAGGNPHVKRFTGGAWQAVGTGAISTDKASGVGITLDKEDNPYIVYAAGTGSTGQITVYGYLNGKWASLNVPATLSGGRKTSGARHADITVSDGKIYVIYMDGSNRSKATVISSPTGSTDWEEAGSTLSTRDATFLNIAPDSLGNIYASFVDAISNGSGRSVARVMRLAKGTDAWTEVVDTGSVTGVDEPSDDLSLAVSDQGSPYIIYTKPDKAGVVTPVVQYFLPILTKKVQKTPIPTVAYTVAGVAKVQCLKNGAWQNVGGDVATADASYTNIFRDHAGKLYVAYVDGGKGNRLAVKTYDATSKKWEPLGGDAANLYVSTGSILNGTKQLVISHNSWMAFDTHDVPYIVYAEMDAGGNPHVKRFTGGAWQAVGTGAISTDKASGVGITVDKEDNPYIVYAAGTGSTGQITVYGYLSGKWTSLDVPATLSGGRKTSGARHADITVSDGKIYVIYMDGSNRSKATVISSPIGSADWEETGSTLSTRDATFLNIAPDSLGNIYASFVDAISNGSGRSVARVMRLSKGSDAWTEVVDTGSVTGVDEPSDDLSLAVSDKGSPYIIYTKPDKAGVATPVVQVYPVPVVKPGDTTVTVTDHGSTVTLSNGIVSFTVDKSTATITNLTYKGVNLLSGGYSGGKIYWSWNMPNYQNPSGCTYTLSVDPGTNDGDYAEIKFHMPWNGSASTAAMDVDIYYSLPRDAQGVYASAMLTHPSSYPANPGGEWRMASYVGSTFDWLSVDSLRNRKMATLTDWEAGTVPDGAPPEVKLLHTGIYTGQYECKYDYSADLGSENVWGWSSTAKDLGIWVTAPSHEYYNGGPMKRELMCHNGPTMLNMLNGQHYGMGGDGAIAAGETWQKVFGPFLIYCNSVPSGTADAPAALWTDAQAQAKKEQSKWPYDWYTNPDYVKESGRGTITGRLVITDSTDTSASAANMWVGAAIPPPSTTGVNDFQLWSKNYQFWTKTDSNGHFTLPHVLPGTYNLYAFGPGAAGQMTKTALAHVTAGGITGLGNVDWTPERIAPTVWSIGIPDRSAAEFKHGTDYWRSDSLPSAHWGKFMDYPDEFPDGITYTIGKSDWSTDWNYVQPYDKNVLSSSPVWTVKFGLTKAPTAGTTAAVYVAYAASYGAASIVTVNGTNITDPSTGVIPPNSSDAMVRKGIHGAFGDHRFAFPAKLLHAGTNEITFTERVTGGGSSGDLMYDYIRLEASGTVATNKQLQTITFDSIADRHLNDPGFRLMATSNAGLPLSYSTSDSSIAIVVNGAVQLLGEGTVKITASQAGDSTWLPAQDVTRTLTITIPRDPQFITFKPIPGQYLGRPDFNLEATTTSGLPLTYTSNNTAVANILNGQVHLLGVGPVTITASQAGDNTWLPADTAQSFQVKVLQKPSYNRILTPNGDGINDQLVIQHLQGYPGNRLEIFDESGKLIYEKSGYDNDWNGRVNGRIVAKGTYYFVLTSNHKVKIKGSVTIIH